VVILGPTASGKTTLAISLAGRFDGEIVNCDSVSLYRDFEIGTAKPNAEQRRQVRHHLLDCLNPAGYVTAGEYARLAREALDDIRKRRKLPIVAGGSGLYLRALLEGLFSGPQRLEHLRDRLRLRQQQKGSAYLHGILDRLDPAAAARIHAHDTAKLIRAIEVCVASRQPMSEMWKQGRDPLQGFRILRVGLNPDRARLYQRINQRARFMFDRGLVEETRLLLANYGESSPPLKSLGYKQAAQFLNREIGKEEALEEAQQAHRNYAKRQITWFRREPDVTWLGGFGDESSVQDEAARLVRAAQAAEPSLQQDE